MKGADKGPAALIEASQYLEFLIETDSEVLNKGILLQYLFVLLLQKH